MSPPEQAGQGGHRRQRRVGVGLPVIVHGTGLDGEPFEEMTISYDVSRSGLSFSTRHLIQKGMEIEIMIPKRVGAPTSETDFVSRARVVRVVAGADEDERIVGVEFIGPRFHRVFVPEGTS